MQNYKDSIWKSCARQTEIQLSYLVQTTPQFFGRGWEISR